MIEDVYDEESSSLENMILIPLYVCGLFTISYLDNPIMKTYGKYLLVASSFVFTFYTLELVDAELWVLGVIGLSLGLLFLVLEFLKVP